MAIALELQGIVAEFQRMLECQSVCFLPGCPDADIRHPLLECVSLPVVYATPARAKGTFGGVEIWREERIQALCDLALQSGQMQTLFADELLRKRQGLRSIAALPLEVSRKMLGCCVLGDDRAEQFGVGERSLLYACLSMRLPALERALWAEVELPFPRACRRAMQERNDEAGSSPAPEQFIRSEFVAMVGHELRAPLSVIKGYAALLQAYGGNGQQRLEPEQQRRYLEALVGQSDLLELLVNDLLDISRLQRGELVLRPRALDVEALCQQVVRRGQLRAEQRAPGMYHLICDCAEPLPPLWADGERLQQVLMNVLENAIKYSPQGGSIELIARAPDEQQEQVAITVRDQGIGIPAQRITNLFQPFERLERSATAHIAGMGMGLYLARKLVEAMNGKIELKSCEGRGTDVTIHLPAVRLNKRLATDAMAQASIF